MKSRKDLLTGEKQARIRDKRGRFVKGASGNPKGRPKDDNIADRLFPLVPKAIARIEQILDSAEATDRDVIKAAEIVIDRVYGKAQQAVQIEETDTTVRIIETDPEAADWNG